VDFARSYYAIGYELGINGKAEPFPAGNPDATIRDANEYVEGMTHGLIDRCAKTVSAELREVPLEQAIKAVRIINAILAIEKESK
jgi:hypothetical protein